MEKTNQKQIEFGRLLGLDISGLSVDVAKAMILDSIEKNFDGKEIKKASDRQIALGIKFDYDLSSFTKKVASAFIREIMVMLNFQSIEMQNIKPGDYVLNKYDRFGKEYIVSSISKNGYLYFKRGGGGAARYMIKYPKNLIENIISNTSQSGIDRLAFKS